MEEGRWRREGEGGYQGKGREGIKVREGGWSWVGEGREREGSSMVSCVRREVGKRGKSSVLILFEYACTVVSGVEWWKISNLHLPPSPNIPPLSLSPFPPIPFLPDGPQPAREGCSREAGQHCLFAQAVG